MPAEHPPLPIAELRLIVAAAGTLLEAAVLELLAAGLRVCEIVALEVGHVDTNANTLDFSVAKTGERRRITLPDAVANWARLLAYELDYDSTSVPLLGISAARVRRIVARAASRWHRMPRQPARFPPGAAGGRCGGEWWHRKSRKALYLLALSNALSAPQLRTLQSTHS